MGKLNVQLALKPFTAGRGEPVCLKHRSLERWATRHLGSIDHENRVAAIAATLFDLTWSLHGLSPADRRLLRCSAIVHDVGRSIDDDTHPEQGARMLMEDHHLPLTHSERRGLAYLTLYHKGHVPNAGDDEILRSGDDADRLRIILALLRAADALDGRSLESPRLVFALEGRRLRIHCYLETDSAKARRVYSRRKKFRLLEEMLDCRVDIEIARAESLHLVA